MRQLLRIKKSFCQVKSTNSSTWYVCFVHHLQKSLSGNRCCCILCVYVCPTCMLCMSYMYVCCVCPTCMYAVYVLHVCCTGSTQPPLPPPLGSSGSLLSSPTKMVSSPDICLLHAVPFRHKTTVLLSHCSWGRKVRGHCLCVCVCVFLPT